MSGLFGSNVPLLPIADFIFLLSQTAIVEYSGAVVSSEILNASNPLESKYSTNPPFSKIR